MRFQALAGAEGKGGYADGAGHAACLSARFMSGGVASSVNNAALLERDDLVAFTSNSEPRRCSTWARRTAAQSSRYW